MIDEVIERKSTAKAKLKATSQQDRIHLRSQHFENLLGNSPEVTHEPITRIINKQLDIKLRPFIQEELDSVLRKIKNSNSSMKYPQKCGRREYSTTYCSDTVMPYIIKVLNTD